MNINDFSIQGGKTIFIHNQINNNNKDIIINKDIDLVGDDCTIVDNIFVSSHCTFHNILFKNSVVYLKKGAEVEFNNCRFEGSDKSSSIVLVKEGKSFVTINKCTFVNCKNAIKINDNYAISIEDNYFQGCGSAIEADNESFMEDASDICGNTMLSSKESIFINIDSFKGKFKEVLKLARGLTFDNNNGRVVCIKDYEVIIDTYNYYVENTRELILAIADASHGAIVYLKSNIYNGDIEINKSIMIIGDKGAVIVPNEKSKNKAAFLINASNIIIKNILITTNSNIKFRDGIVFFPLGGAECEFINIIVESTRRRGISVWGKATNYTKIVQCTFKDIVEGTAINVWRDVIIDGCRFDNCLIGILKKFDGGMNITESKFRKIGILISTKKKYLDEIVLKNNEYYWINMFFNNL
ncbi:MAG: hypothetical protein RSA29_02205 [Clostridium sp.]|uniref:hypothetical protein n=1 Tax=Clostridium sp. TaxID=1506 RepID=UPI00302FEC51